MLHSPFPFRAWGQNSPVYGCVNYRWGSLTRFRYARLGELWPNYRYQYNITGTTSLVLLTFTFSLFSTPRNQIIYDIVHIIGGLKDRKGSLLLEYLFTQLLSSILSSVFPVCVQEVPNLNLLSRCLFPPKREGPCIPVLSCSYPHRLL